MTEDGAKSRRAVPRVRCRWQVKCVTENKKTFDTKTINISEGGVQIFTPVPFKKGDRLYMEISGYLGGQSHLIKVVGEGVYVSLSSTEGMQLGLKFVSQLKVEDLKFIRTYVKSMLT